MFLLSNIIINSVCKFILCISCHPQSAKLIWSSKMNIIIICSTSFPSIYKKKQKYKVKGIIFRYFKGQKLPLIIFENRFFSLLPSWANYYNAGILLLFACLKCISFLQPWDNKTCNIQAHPLTCLSTSTLRQGLHFFPENISVTWFDTGNSFCRTSFR